MHSVTLSDTMIVRPFCEPLCKCEVPSGSGSCLVVLYASQKAGCDRLAPVPVHYSAAHWLPCQDYLTSWRTLLQLYDEMGSRHRVRPPLINIIKTATVPDSQCKRDNTKQFHQSYDEENNKQVRVKFPLTRKLVR